MADLFESMKQIALNAVNSGNPTSIVFGEVTSAAPLRIKIDQKIILEGDDLVLTRNVTDFKTPVSYEYETEDVDAHTHDVNIPALAVAIPPPPSPLTGSTAPAVVTSLSANKHRHVYKLERKEYTVHNALKVGEHVVLIQMQGGRRWVVLDRIGGAS